MHINGDIFKGSSSSLEWLLFGKYKECTVKDLTAWQFLFRYPFEYTHPGVPTQVPDTHPAVEEGILNAQIGP